MKRVLIGVASIFIAGSSAFAIPPSAPTPGDSELFGGYLVASAAGQRASAAQVVLMRDGDATVLTVRGGRVESPEQFSMIVSVPQSLSAEDIVALDDRFMGRLDQLTSPRLVEYFERDVCALKHGSFEAPSAEIHGRELPAVLHLRKERARSRAVSGVAARTPVVIEGAFDVGEYEVAVLNSTDPVALEAWLVANGYATPEGASKALAASVEKGHHVVAARLNMSRVKVDEAGVAELSSLRLAYEAADVSVPAVLGVGGSQDVIVHALSREGRFEAASRPNVLLSTNLFVDEGAGEEFGPLYQRVVEAARGDEQRAVVTEYVWGEAPRVYFAGSSSGAMSHFVPSCEHCVDRRGGWGSILLGLGAEVTGVESSDFQAAHVDVIAEVEGVMFAGVPAEVGGSVDASDEASRIKATLEGKRGELQRCYRELQRRVGDLGGRADGARLPSRIDVPLAFGEGGHLDAEAMNSLYFNQWELSAGMRILECALSSGSPARVGGVSGLVDRPGRVNVQLRFDARYFDREWLNLDGWTVTRLRVPRSIDELVLRSAPPIEGGVGLPVGKRPKLPSGAENAVMNSFQARYIVLRRYESRMCLLRRTFHSLPPTSRWLEAPHRR